MSRPENHLNRPTIVAVVQNDSTPGLVDLQLHIPADLSCFKGHFPTFQILPGVVQLKWVVDCAKEFLSVHNSFKTIERLKFTCPIQPLMSINLQIQHNADKRFIDFRFYDETQGFAQGRLCYE